MSKASALSETIADEILSGATYRNTELWDEYPEYHDLSYTVNKDGPAKAELGEGGTGRGAKRWRRPGSTA